MIMRVIIPIIIIACLLPFLFPKQKEIYPTSNNPKTYITFIQNYPYLHVNDKIIVNKIKQNCELNPNELNRIIYLDYIFSHYNSPYLDNLYQNTLNYYK